MRIRRLSLQMRPYHPFNFIPARVWVSKLWKGTSGTDGLDTCHVYQTTYFFHAKKNYFSLIGTQIFTIASHILIFLFFPSLCFAKGDRPIYKRQLNALDISPKIVYEYCMRAFWHRLVSSVASYFACWERTCRYIFFDALV